jgi:ribosomal protein S18 acetylase RimI-like enzyme
MKKVELLNRIHNRGKFDCGNDLLNNFLQQTARQHLNKGISRTFVVVDTAEPTAILGFFTLSICEVEIEKIPTKFASKYPDRVAGVKLARLAVDLQSQGQGLGGIMVSETILRVMAIAEIVGIVGLFVDAKDLTARNYYRRYGFDSDSDTCLLMFLPLATIQNTAKIVKSDS